MDRAISELRDERDRTAREALALTGWRCSRTSVAWAIEAMLANSAQSTTALGWLLRQIDGLPESSEKEEAMAKVIDLSFAIAGLARAEATHRRVVPFPVQTGSSPEMHSHSCGSLGVIVRMDARDGEESAPK